MGFKQAGVDVFYEATRSQIRPVVEDLIAGKLQMIGEEQVCGGGEGDGCKH
jgi:predicted Fe-Mo cluster-binding NifX family protein